MEIDCQIRSKDLAQLQARGITAGYRQQSDVTSQSGKVDRHIGAAARHDAVLCLFENRDRCLRGQAADRAINEPVQHDIADHQYFDVFEFLKIR